jgi:hypothetical protein
MSMSFIAGAAAAITIGSLFIGGLAVAPRGGGFVGIPPAGARTNVPGPRHGFVPVRRVTTDAEPGFSRSERAGERFGYAD